MTSFSHVTLLPQFKQAMDRKGTLGVVQERVNDLPNSFHCKWNLKGIGRNSLECILSILQTLQFGDPDD